MDEKSLSPLFPVGAVVTNDWCINCTTLKYCCVDSDVIDNMDMGENMKFELPCAIILSGLGGGCGNCRCT